MSSAQLLAVDVGTQSVRAILFDPEGQLLAKAQIAIEPYVAAQPGWAEQDANTFWAAISQACRQLWEQGNDPGAVVAMALTCQRATTVCVDDAGEPLRPAIVWLDQRRAHTPKPVAGLWGLAFKVSRVGDIIADFQRKAPANWLAEQQPDILQRTHKFLLLSGYLNFRLTGAYVDALASQVGYIPFDFRRLCWAGKRDWKWQAVAVRRSQLPELVEPGERLGSLSQAAAAELNLPEGLPVIAAGGDKACEVLGAGCIAPHQACLSFGTTATISTTMHSYLEVHKHLPPYPAAMPDAYTAEIQIQRGFWMVSWFKNQFAQLEKKLAAEHHVSAESLFDTMIRDVPPGSMGLVLQPYWSPGVREPGPEAKGAVIGFGDVHTRAHFYRAILEGLIYALRDAREQIEARAERPISVLRVAGGGSQSDVAMQITADVFGLPAERPHVYEASALGAAINAAVGMGIHADHEAAVQAMTRPGQVFSPRDNQQAIYDALYTRVYKRMYKQLKPLYKDIREITGYPP